MILPLFLFTGCVLGPQDLPRLRQSRDQFQAQIWEIERQNGFRLSTDGLEAHEKDLLEKAKAADSRTRQLDGRAFDLAERDKAVTAREKAVEDAERIWYTSLSPQDQLAFLMHLDNMQLQKTVLQAQAEEGARNRQNLRELEERRIQAARWAQASEHMHQNNLELQRAFAPRPQRRVVTSYDYSRGVWVTTEE